MKYIITGSIGNISKPIVKQLVSAGHAVTVISNSPAKKLEIESLGAAAAIGSVTDREFLKQAFAGADATYLMIPPDPAVTDLPASQKEISDNYVSAIQGSGIRHVVLLSSIGAHLRKGAGPIDGLAYLEEQLEKLEGIHVKMLRPSYFYSNLLAMGGLIKHAGIMGANFGNTEEKLVLTHTDDIAAEAGKQLLDLGFKGHSIQYISSDERHPVEIAEVLSKAIHKPNTPWVTFKDEEALQGMLQAGLSPTMAEALTQMGRSLREGRLQEDYFRQKATPKGKIKLEDFAKEFASVYERS